MRMQCLCSLQPYSKKQLRAQDFMKFPWESEEQKASFAEAGKMVRAVRKSWSGTGRLRKRQG